MPEIVIPLIVIGIGVLLTGPAALVISIIALNKAKGSASQSQPPKTMAPPIQPPREPLPLSAAPKPQPPEKVEELPFAAIVKPAVPSPSPKVDIPKPIKIASLEQRIGTRWILIAGIVCVFIAVGFFINYAYKYFTMGPLGKTLCIGICGLIALTVGEITRRRGYDIVAKGVTSLGFAILYATVFSAYRFYALIEATPAFAIATLITASALIYAIRLDEVLIAFLSLLGGFLTPAIVSTGQNLPGPLFTYLLILSLGALACSYFRKWPSINLLAFLGTFALYTGWFEKFYRPDMEQTSQMTVTLTWLGVFFAVYLILPLLHGLIKKARAYKQDATLILMNATVTFYYLWTILHADHRTALALCAVALCVIHLILLAIVRSRCKDDTNLHLILLAVGLFFLTVAFPIYFRMYTLAITWAAEGVLLTLIGLRYRSILTQIAASAALILSVFTALSQLPLHEDAFKFILNTEFGTWCFVIAGLYLCHLIYRNTGSIDAPVRNKLSQYLYATAVLLLMFVVSMEWWSNCDFNLVINIESSGPMGQTIILALTLLLFMIRPLCPEGNICRTLAVLTAGCGAIFTMSAFPEFYTDSFMIFANAEFVIAIAFVAACGLACYIIHAASDNNRTLTIAFGLVAVLLLWVILTEEIYLYWHCLNKYAGPVHNWQFLSQMYISITWALYGAMLMIMGFWRKIKMLRYTAIVIFALLLVKVNFDINELEGVYRIATFLATGLTLVGVSYLYQFLKKKGFFEAMLESKT